MCITSSRTEALQTAADAADAALEAQSVTVEINPVKIAHAFQRFQTTREYLGKIFCSLPALGILSEFSLQIHEDSLGNISSHKLKVPIRFLYHN